jgi:hypothetical protein
MTNTMRQRLLLCLVCLLGLSACGASPSEPLPPTSAGGADAAPVDAGPDGSSVQNSGRLRVFAGIGAPGQFRPIDDPTPLELQRGCQGAQHIFTGVRVVGAVGAVARVVVRVMRKSDGMVVSSLLDQRLPYERDETEASRRITGLRPVIEVPKDVLDQVAVVEVVIDDEDGTRASDVFEGVVAWGADSCGSH